MRIAPAVAVMAVCAALPLPAQDEMSDLQNQVLRVRKELAQVQSERIKNKEVIQEDGEKFDEYRERTDDRFRAIRAETDSIYRAIGGLNKQVDSLNAAVGGLKARQRGYELRQQKLRDEVIAGSDRFIQAAYAMPPMVSNQLVVALHYLRSEAASQSTDNIEALHRLDKTIRDLETITSNLQITQGTSPVPEVTGTSYRLRIGTLFEAVVDAKGEKYALWTGSDRSGSPEWKTGDDPETGAAILKAVQIRGGKALPAFVTLPYMNTDKTGPAGGTR